MKPWTRLAEATTSDGKKLSLLVRDGIYVIRRDGVELMSTRESQSEEKLAEWGVEGLAPQSKILIGGLGLGFTLKKALQLLPAESAVTIAEISPEVIAWNQVVTLPLAHQALKDKRVTTFCGDFADLLSPTAFDRILLDVDNGPDDHPRYEIDSLQKIWRSLTPGGKLLVWSVDDSPRFLKRLQLAGFHAETRVTRAGGMRTIFMARKER